MATGLSVCRAAAIAIGHLDPLETLSDGDAAFILGELNQLFDEWNAERDAVYADVFTTYSTVGSLSPHTIGPTGTFVTAQRPVTIDGAHWLMSSTTRSPIGIRDKNWWFAQSAPAQTSISPSELYYDPTWPNGSIYFWPVPGGVISIELMTRMVLASIALATTFTMPPGYLSAVTLTLAENIAASLLGSSAPPKIEQRAAQARARVSANNRRPTPKLRTRDDGIPGGRRGEIGFNYRTGQWDC